MTSNGFEQKMSDFKQYLKKMKSFEEAIGLIYWDMRTGAPKKGIANRSEVVGMLSGEHFKMSVANEMGEWINYFTEQGQDVRLSRVDRKIVAECKKEYDRSKRIPQQKYQDYVVLTSQAESVWEEAKHESDYARFQPYLEKIVATNLEFIDLWGYEGHKYNTLLDMYEPGMTVSKLDQVFGALREKVVPLLGAIQASAHKPETGFLRQTFDKEQQKKFSLFILGQILKQAGWMRRYIRSRQVLVRGMCALRHAICWMM
jgi:carboxypeptidase Taq